MKNPEMIQVDKLRTFENHPYKVEENEEMKMLTQSIKENGILSPLIVRPIENSEYEIVSGHRRLFASKRAGLTEVPAFVYEMDRDRATIALVDSNLHREHLLPSEKAFAYKMKVEAMSRQGERTDLTSFQVGKRLNTYEVIAEESGESRNQIHRYIRLTNLLPELLKFVDDGQISFTPAVELSYLNDIEQRDLLQAMELNDCTPSLSQAVRMKKLSQAWKLDDDKIGEIMAEEKSQSKGTNQNPDRACAEILSKGISLTLRLKMQLSRCVKLNTERNKVTKGKVLFMVKKNIPNEKELLELIEEIKANSLKSA